MIELRSASENAQRSTLNFQRPIQILCVERWTLLPLYGWNRRQTASLSCRAMSRHLLPKIAGKQLEIPPLRSE